MPPGKPKPFIPPPFSFDARVLKLLKDVADRTATVPAFVRGLELWQWLVFARWHLGRDADPLGNPFLLRDDRRLVLSEGRFLVGRIPNMREHAGLVFVNEHLVREGLPDEVVQYLVDQNRRAARQWIDRHMAAPNVSSPPAIGVE
jgi:hypothetical protein